MCNNVQQCTFVYISEHFSFLNPLILAHRNAHRKTFFHIEKHFCTFLNIFVMCISCTFLYIFAHRKSRFVRKHCGTFFKYRFVRNIVEHFSFRAPADVRGNVLKCFKQKTTFLHISSTLFCTWFCTTFQVHFDFTRNKACFSMFSMCIFPKMFFYVQKCFSMCISDTTKTTKTTKKQQH